MTLEDIKKYFVTSHEFNAKTGMSRTCWVNWKKYGYVPLNSQLKIERLTDGKLQARFEDR
jgi:hypothetical protein